MRMILKTTQKTILTMALIPILLSCSANNVKQQDNEKQNVNNDSNITAPTPQDSFFAHLTSHCGKAYSGSLVSNDLLDKNMAGKPMAIHFTDCTETQIKIPFHIERETNEWDRSRTWVITRTDDGLRLKHDHRHADGSEDKVTQYGGDTADQGNIEKQSFPVDQESIDLFNKNGLTTSATNIWSIGITKGDSAKYSYQMERVNRNFRVEFDLTKPIKTPPPAWGHKVNQAY